MNASDTYLEQQERRLREHYRMQEVKAVMILRDRVAAIREDEVQQVAAALFDVQPNVPPNGMDNRAIAVHLLLSGIGPRSDAYST